MERIRTVIIGCILMSLSPWAHADISKVNVKKIEQDLYLTSDGSYIQTNACYVEADGKDAVLKFEKYACDNNLRFNETTTCEVVGVLK
jgi:hypothetical protein